MNTFLGNTLFYKEPLYKEPACRKPAKKLKELVLLKTKSLRSFSSSNIFINANNAEFGSWFPLLQSNFHEFCVTDVASASQRDLSCN